MRHLLLPVLCLAATAIQGAEPALPSKQEVKALIDDARTYLIGQFDADGGIKGEKFRLGVTELAVISLLQSGSTVADEPMQKALTFIRSHVQKDGGIYNQQEGLGNYCTSLGLQALCLAGEKDKTLIRNAQKYLVGLQNLDEKSSCHGGIGYGSRGPTNEDLSNTAMAIEALRKSGMPATDPALERALKFVQRCQNLSGVNDQEWAKKGKNDGSGVYSPDSSMAGGSWTGTAKAEQKPPQPGMKPETLSGYGSMTYALITSYIYLDLKPEDPRVQAAMGWIAKNYGFDANPGLPAERARQGLFYYYRLAAKTMGLAATTTIDRGEPGKADWRADLFAALKQRAVGAKDGGKMWMNDADRWHEGDPRLVTAYVLASLAGIHSSLP